MHRAALAILLLLTFALWLTPPANAQGGTPAPIPTLLPTPAPLSAGEVLPAMGVVMGRASEMSTQQIGMFILALSLFVSLFELLRVLLIKRSNR